MGVLPQPGHGIRKLPRPERIDFYEMLPHCSLNGAGARHKVICCLKTGRIWLRHCWRDGRTDAVMGSFRIEPSAIGG
jgi:hypothetical protein